MRGFETANPAVIFIYFIAVSSVVMFCAEPLLLSLSLVGAVLLFLIKNKFSKFRTHLFFVAVFLVTAVINPLFSHNGVTVLFMLNGNPVTLEAILFGISSAAAIVTVLYWFAIFSQYMSADKLLYIFGKVSPKLSLVLTMALRYIPLFTKQAEKVRNTQQASGLYKENDMLDSVKRELGVFSVMITWALENGIITADSMEARGYGIGKRSAYSVFHFTLSDALLLISEILLTAIVFTAAALGRLSVDYYPALLIGERDLLSVMAYSAYAVLVFIPSVTELSEVLKWKYLRQRI